MEQLTVRKLMGYLAAAAKKDPSILDKKIVVADDVEGNGYHGMWYGPTSDPSDVAGVIHGSMGVSDSDEEDPAKLVILG